MQCSGHRHSIQTAASGGTGYTTQRPQDQSQKIQCSWWRSGLYTAATTGTEDRQQCLEEQCLEEQPILRSDHKNRIYKAVSGRAAYRMQRPQEQNIDSNVWRSMLYYAAATGTEYTKQCLEERPIQCSGHRNRI